MDIKSIFSKFLSNQGEARPQAGVRFGISWPLLVALSLVLICAVGWAFFMGLMVGRGQNPQASLESISGLAKPAQPAIIEAAPAEEPRPPVERTELKPLEEPAQEIISAAAPPIPKEEKPKARAKPVARPKSSVTEKFDYTFQGAAFRSQAEAKKASVNLNKNGVRSVVQKSGKVYLVVISLRGGSKEVEELQNKMKSLKMGKPMQLSKKPVDKSRRK